MGCNVLFIENKINYNTMFMLPKQGFIISALLYPPIVVMHVNFCYCLA